MPGIGPSTGLADPLGYLALAPQNVATANVARTVRP
jgi:hypothetical protein